MDKGKVGGKYRINNSKKIFYNIGGLNSYPMSERKFIPSK